MKEEIKREGGLLNSIGTYTFDRNNDKNKYDLTRRKEEDDDSEDDFDLINNELKVSITMKYDEDNDWYIIELKKKQGTYEDYYKLYKESENIVKGFADKFTA